MSEQRPDVMAIIQRIDRQLRELAARVSALETEIKHDQITKRSS